MTANVLAYQLAVLNVNGTERAESSTVDVLLSLFWNHAICAFTGPPVQYVCDQTRGKAG